jgi:hypothetical protein
MAGEVAVQNAKSWREAAFKAGKGRKFFEALQEEIRCRHYGPELRRLANENADLISSLPLDVARRVARQGPGGFRRPAFVRRLWSENCASTGCISRNPESS